jgi:hypothetical protein
VYHSDLATLRFLSEARSLTIAADVPGSSPVIYDLWNDQRASLKSLVSLLSGFR